MKCAWNKDEYDHVTYIRVIRRIKGISSLNYICWLRNELVGPIYDGTKQCNLAIEFDSGVRCVQCKLGCTLEGGKCINCGKPKLL